MERWDIPGWRHGVRRSPGWSIPLLTKPPGCQAQGSSIPMWSQRSESPCSGFSFQRMSQWTLSSVLAQPPESTKSGLGRWGHSSEASGGVREDELRFQLPAAFLDLWTVQNSTGPSRKTTNPALECTQWKELGRPGHGSSRYCLHSARFSRKHELYFQPFPTLRGDSRWGHTVSNHVPQPPALPDGFPSSSNPQELPEARLVLAQLSTPQSKYV